MIRVTVKNPQGETEQWENFSTTEEALKKYPWIALLLECESVAHLKITFKTGYKLAVEIVGTE